MKSEPPFECTSEIIKRSRLMNREWPTLVANRWLISPHVRSASNKGTSLSVRNRRGAYLIGAQVLDGNEVEKGSRISI